MEYCLSLDWKGMSASEWAAWAQAILSALAIVAAAFIAGSQERRTMRRRIDAYVEIINHAASDATATASTLEHAVGERVRSDETDEWKRLCQVFDAIQFHEVPDHRLFGVVRDAARSCARIRDMYEPMLTSNSGVSERLYMMVKNEELTLQQCYEDASEISNELAGMNIRGRIRYGWRRAKRLCVKAFERVRK